MKFLAATIAGTLSMASAHMEYHEYHYDPARAQRARDFYKGLVLTEVDKFDEHQQTQLYMKEVGGAVCQAFDSYALFDFNKLSKYNVDAAKPDAVHVLSPDDGTTTWGYLVYKVCGGAFEPKVENLNTDLDVITDLESCKKMFDNGDTKGNVYLVKDGACIQSFNNAEFSAEVEVQEDASKPMKQEWELEYKSTQKCATDNTKDFELTIEGVCSTEETTTLTTEEINTCSAKLLYKSPGACYIKYLPLTKYME